MPRKGEGYLQKQGLRRRKHGNHNIYLYLRIARENPDYHARQQAKYKAYEDLSEAEQKAVRQDPKRFREFFLPEYRQAIEAGVIKDPKAGGIIDAMFRLWLRATSDERQAFAWLCECEDDDPMPIRQRTGPGAWINKNAPVELIKAAEVMNLTDIARSLGVSRQTVGRWASGQNTPRAAVLDRLKTLTAA